MVGTAGLTKPVTQEFLDQNQYSMTSILRYERIFGHNWVSTGGESTTTEFCEQLHLKRGQRVLDVGCGTGGSAFFMAQKYGVTVRGVDLSTHMLSIAKDRLTKLPPHVQDKVSFELADISTSTYPEDEFDVVYSRDTILHIADKEGLFKKLLLLLKPGGILFVTDYCSGDQEHSEEFLEYVRRRGYHLRTVKEYGQILEKVGFKDVEAKDMTQRFIDILGQELENFQHTKEQFIMDFSENDYIDIDNGWSAKQKRCRSGDQAWGLFIGFK